MIRFITSIILSKYYYCDITLLTSYNEFNF